MTCEEWKDIPGWEGLYEVSDAGRTRSCTRDGVTQFGVRKYAGIVLKQMQRANGYLVVNLTHGKRRRQVLVHRAVLEAFVGECQAGHQACHNNGIRQDNRLENLRWDSVCGNHADKVLHGTAQRGEKNPNSRLSEDAVRHIRASDLSHQQLADQLGVSVGCVEKVRYHTTWRHVR